MTQIIFFLLPIFLANVIHHFFVIRYNLFPFLAKPIDNKKRWRNRRIFGDNKTYRGFVIVMFLTALFSLILSFFISITTHTNPILLGLFIGFGYLFGELPNSFIKRQLSIPESTHARDRKKILFSIIDHTDSIFMTLVFLFIFEPISLKIIFILFVLGVSLHLSGDHFLHKFSYKKKLNL